MAVILVVAVWLDRGEVPLLIGFLICFPLLYNAMHTAIAGVDAELLQMAEVSFGQTYGDISPFRAARGL